MASVQQLAISGLFSTRNFYYTTRLKNNYKIIIIKEKYSKLVENKLHNGINNFRERNPLTAANPATRHG